MSTSVKIKISQIYSPNELYMKFLEGKTSENNEKLRKHTFNVQDKIAKLAKSCEKIKNPKIDEIYGCYIPTWKKWVRGKIVYKHPDGYKVFCADHGHFKYGVSEFIEIQDNFKTINSAFYRASLDLKPTHSSNKWREATISICNDINNKRDTLDFRFVPYFVNEKNTFIGDLIVLENGTQYNLSEKLVGLGLAKKSKCDFKSLVNEMLDKNISPIGNIQPRKRLEMPEKEKFLRPNDKIVHGNDLKKVWDNVDDCQFQKCYKRKISIENDAQKVIWPQIVSGKHAIIVSSDQDCQTSLYLLPLINSLTENRYRRILPEHCGPRAIIFASNSSRINEIAKECHEWATNMLIIKATGHCKDKKMDMANGCDILLTTPPAFVRLIENVHFKIIDENRLKWIVFDGFDQNSFIRFDSQISVVLKMLYKTAVVPQTIVASKTPASYVKNRIMKCLQNKNTVLYIDNHLDAAIFIGINFNIEIATENEENFMKLPFKDYEKTVIVINDEKVAANLETKFSAMNIKALNCDSTKIAKFWDESSTNKCILIINDAILSESSIQNADYLVHQGIPASDSFEFNSIGKQFSQRFKIFSNAIYKRLCDESVALKTTIVLGNDNADQFERFISYMAARNLLKDNIKVIEKLDERKEAIKCLEKVSFCANLIQYGKCNKLSCPNRHKTTEQDKPPAHLDAIKDFITFDLISLQGPTSFVIKIREYFDDKWILYDQENSQQKLEIDMQQYCRDMKISLKSGEGKIGGIYAKFENNLGTWVRGRLIKRVSNEVVTLSLLDHESISPEIPAVEKNLMKLPKDFTKINPSISKLQIMNLLPLDGENSYNKNDMIKMKEFMMRVPKNTVFVAKIEAKIGEILFTKNFEAKSKEKSNIFRLKSAHMKLGISETDASFEEKIKKLEEVFKVPEISSKTEIPATKSENCKPNVQSNLKLKNDPVDKRANQKLWKELKLKKSYSITVKHYISPYSFYVTVNNPENLTLKIALEKIEKSENCEPLINPQVNKYCLVDQIGRKLRGKILSIDQNSLEVLLVDYGDLVKCSQSNLYEIPETSMSLQFQAIHCSMLGICPRFNMKIWPKLQKEAVYGLIDEFNETNSLKMVVTRKKQNSYDVLLYDYETKFFLHKLAVEQRIACECNLDEDKDCYESMSSDEDEDYDSLIGTASSTESSENVPILTKDSDDQFYMNRDAAMRMLAILDENVKNDDDFTNTLSVTDSSTCQLTASSVLPLKCIFKMPQIEWRQNDFMIYLLVSLSKDCNEYSLKVNETSMDIVIKYDDDDKIERAIIQFYGCVRPKLCSHEVVGRNIIVRLSKKFLNVNWLRLTLSMEKMKCIKFSPENVPCKKAEYVEDDESSSGVGLPADMSDFEDNCDDKKIDTSDDEFY